MPVIKHRESKMAAISSLPKNSDEQPPYLDTKRKHSTDDELDDEQVGARKRRVCDVCPSCQVPFSILKSQSSDLHLEECLTVDRSHQKECHLGINCDSTTVSHYLKETHFLLAQFRFGTSGSEAHCGTLTSQSHQSSKCAPISSCHSSDDEVQITLVVKSPRKLDYNHNFSSWNKNPLKVTDSGISKAKNSVQSRITSFFRSTDVAKKQVADSQSKLTSFFQPSGAQRIRRASTRTKMNNAKVNTSPKSCADPGRCSRSRSKSSNCQSVPQAQGKCPPGKRQTVPWAQGNYSEAIPQAQGKYSPGKSTPLSQAQGACSGKRSQTVTQAQVNFSLTKSEKVSPAENKCSAVESQMMLQSQDTYTSKSQTMAQAHVNFSLTESEIVLEAQGIRTATRSRTSAQAQGKYTPTRSQTPHSQINFSLTKSETVSQAQGKCPPEESHMIPQAQDTWSATKCPTLPKAQGTWFGTKTHSVSQNRGKRSFTKNSIATDDGKSDKWMATYNKKCPFYKKILDVPFVVDAFNLGEIPGITAYFLSHFHSDHYGGLRAQFRKTLYCSEVTAQLVKLKIRVQAQYIHSLALDIPHIIQGVEVTLLDANHCPGSVMFLFRFTDGRVLLHTGDFRATTEMQKHPCLTLIDVDMLYLDTTYCQPQYNFPRQEEVVEFAVSLATSYVAAEPHTLIVCGSYSVGKERVFTAIAGALNARIYGSSDKIRMLQCLQDESLTKRLTTDRRCADVHVLPMNDLTFQKLEDHLRSLNGAYTHVLALRPTGWVHDALPASYDLQDIKPKKRGNVVIYGLPYSEHSSFDELKEFVQFINPRQVIPTVNVSGKNSKQQMAILDTWMKNLKC